MLSKKIFLLPFILALLANCQQESQSIPPAAQHQLKIVNNSEQQTEKKPSLLFFMNPDGAPCIMQDRIILQIKSSIESRVNIVYVKTSNSGDREYFYSYGIRAIPSIILLDSTGNIAKRFQPGIQDKETLTQEIQKLSQ